MTQSERLNRGSYYAGHVEDGQFVITASREGNVAEVVSDWKYNDIDELAQRLVAFLAADEASVDTLEQYVASVLTTRANLAYAPWSVGGARPFFTPSWVPAFERNVPGWRYEERVFGYGGRVFLTGPTGAKLAALFLTLTRKERGGRLEHDEARGLYRFTPDADAGAHRWAMVPAKRKRIVRPDERPAAQALILPGGAA